MTSVVSDALSSKVIVGVEHPQAHPCRGRNSASMGPVWVTAR